MLGFGELLGARRPRHADIGSHDAKFSATGDETKPICSRCRRGKRQCMPADPVKDTFRHGHNPSRIIRANPHLRYGERSRTFDERAEWVGVPATRKAVPQIPCVNAADTVEVDFVDETEAVISGYVAPVSQDNTTFPLSGFSELPTQLPDEDYSSAEAFSPRTRTLPSSSHLRLAASCASFPRRVQRSDIHHPEGLSLSGVLNVPSVRYDTGSTPQQPRAGENASSTPPEMIVSSIPTTQLGSYEQAYLMRVFADQWGPGVSQIPTYSLISTN